MDARPVLFRIARLLAEHRLEAVLIGNAAAAALGAVILRPYYPASDLFRIVRDEDGLQIDFMGSIHGVRSFASLRSRARVVAFEDATAACGGPGRCD